MKDRWQVWRSTKGKVMGICIIHRCSDHGFKLTMQPDGLTEEDRLDFCEDVCRKLNQYDLLRRTSILPSVKP